MLVAKSHEHKTLLAVADTRRVLLRDVPRFIGADDRQVGRRARENDAVAPFAEKRFHDEWFALSEPPRDRIVEAISRYHAHARALKLPQVALAQVVPDRRRVIDDERACVREDVDHVQKTA